MAERRKSYLKDILNLVQEAIEYGISREEIIEQINNAKYNNVESITEEKQNDRNV